MTVSADCFAVRENGAEDFLASDGFGWRQLIMYVQKFKHLIWGRKTYEEVLSWGDKYWNDLKKFPVIVVGTSSPERIEDNVTVCSSPKEALQLVQSWGYQRALLSGGPSINASFVNAGFVDEIILNCSPVFIGSGKHFLGDIEKDVFVELLENKVLENDSLMLRYKVKG